MPHRCVRCGTMYADGAEEILKGCNSCGARLFLFVKKEKLEEANKVIQKLSAEDKKQMEEDVKEIIGVEREDDTPVVLDFESIRVLKPGKFELDLVHLFNKKDPLVFKLEDGKYFVDVVETFSRKEEVNKEK
ncbi:Zn-ribbon domain-containing protein [Nanoarchaeota archaeon]